MRLGRWRSWWVPAAGILVLANSFAPWWEVKLEKGGRVALDYGSGIGRVSAWQADWRWALAVVIAVVSTGVWTGWRWRAGRVPEWLRGLLLLVTLVPIVLTVHLVARIPRSEPIGPLPIDNPGGNYFGAISAVRNPGDPYTVEGVVPHHLLQDADHGPGWGLYAGVVSLLLLVVAMAAGAGDPKR